MDVLYVHPAKQEVEARYDLYRACAPYPFIPVGVIGLVNLLQSHGYKPASAEARPAPDHVLISLHLVIGPNGKFPLDLDSNHRYPRLD